MRGHGPEACAGCLCACLPCLPRHARDAPDGGAALGGGPRVEARAARPPPETTLPLPLIWDE